MEAPKMTKPTSLRVLSVQHTGPSRLGGES